MPACIPFISSSHCNHATTFCGHQIHIGFQKRISPMRSVYISKTDIHCHRHSKFCCFLIYIFDGPHKLCCPWKSLFSCSTQFYYNNITQWCYSSKPSSGSPSISRCNTKYLRPMAALILLRYKSQTCSPASCSQSTVNFFLCILRTICKPFRNSTCWSIVCIYCRLIPQVKNSAASILISKIRMKIIHP